MSLELTGFHLHPNGATLHQIKWINNKPCKCLENTTKPFVFSPLLKTDVFHSDFVLWCLSVILSPLPLSVDQVWHPFPAVVWLLVCLLQPATYVPNMSHHHIAPVLSQSQFFFQHSLASTLIWPFKQINLSLVSKPSNDGGPFTC